MPLAALKLPTEAIYQQFIPKQQFYEHGNFTQAEKRLFIDGVKRLTLYAQLTRTNTNIDPYKDDTKTYEEIAIFLVELKQKDKLDKIATLIMESIPYPIVLVAKYNDKYTFYGAHQRDNQVDKDKIILDRMYHTGFIDLKSEFIEQINYHNISKNNFYTLYDDYIQTIIQFNLSVRNVKSIKNKEEILNEIERLEETISLLRNKLKREQQFNKKMDINMKIKRKEKKLKQMEG